MNQRYWRLLATIIMGFILSGCALLEPPPTLVVPTPRATPRLTLVPSNLPLIEDPVSSISPSLDPAIQALLSGPGGVSEDQLQLYVRTLQGFGTRHTLSEVQADDRGVGAARRWIYNSFLEVGNGRLEVRFDDFPAQVNGLVSNQRNVVATLQGRSGYEGVVLITAHYDTRGANINDGTVNAPGADDNASGVAMLLEVARVMSTRDWEQTIMFVAFAVEEQNTQGSRHFVQNVMIRNNVQIDGVINNDTIGGRVGIPQTVRMFAEGTDTSSHREFARYFRYINGLYNPEFPITLINALDREGRWGDQREFVNAGIPALRITESQEDPSLLNSITDTYEKIDYNYLARVTRLNLAVVANFAGAPARPEPPSVAAMATPGSFIMTWIPDRFLAGYAISYRPVGSDDYPPLRFVNSNEAGHIALTDLVPGTTYAVSIAGIDANGRISMFSPEVIVSP